ncbi:MAG: M20/M25/M40 family metallo-hydrolase [Spirochaetes bacterium]|nr:M20/M25/M40 family metallo-hydrolase [Spirochaetota bacterium]
MDNIFSRINKKQLINTFIKLIKIDSLSLKEKKFIDYLCKTFQDLGLRVKLQKVGQTGNIVAFLPGRLKNDPFFANAHMDTVTPGTKIKPIIKENLIKTDGSTILGGDDKAAIAIFIEAIKMVNKFKLMTHPVYFVLTYGEEIGLEGAKHFDFSLLKCKQGFSFDAGGAPGTMVLSAPTHVVYEINVFGKSAHAGIEPEKGKNAIKIASELIHKIRTGKLDKQTTANVGQIEGGRATNIVPDFVKFTGEIRSRNRSKWQKYIQAVKSKCRLVSKKYQTKITCDFKQAYRSYCFSKTDTVVKKAIKACNMAGLKVKFDQTNGGSDSNIFNQHGFQTLNLGIGLNKVHSQEEFIYIKDLVNGLKMALALMTN